MLLICGKCKKSFSEIKRFIPMRKNAKMTTGVCESCYTAYNKNRQKQLAKETDKFLKE